MHVSKTTDLPRMAEIIRQPETRIPFKPAETIWALTKTYSMPLLLFNLFRYLDSPRFIGSKRCLTVRGLQYSFSSGKHLANIINYFFLNIWEAVMDSGITNNIENLSRLLTMQMIFSIIVHHSILSL